MIGERRRLAATADFRAGATATDIVRTLSSAGAPAPRLTAAGALERVAQPAQDAAQDGDLAARRRGARDELPEIALDAADRRVAGEADAAQEVGELVEEAGDLVAGGARPACRDCRARPR